MQSWIRRPKKEKKDKEKEHIIKQNNQKIGSEKSGRVIYGIATVVLIVYTSVLISKLTLSNCEWGIALESLLVLIVSICVSVKRINPYCTYAILMFVVLYGIIAIIVLINNQITISPQIIKWISAISLIITIGFEWIKIYREIIKESKEQEAKYVQENKRVRKQK